MLDVAQLAPETPRPFRRSEYERLVQLGVFDDERIELLRGVIVQMSPQGSHHAHVVDRLTMLLATRVSGRALVRVQGPLAATEDSEPEPDLALIPPDTGPDAHPSTASLTIEVADTSLAKDRTVKPAIYAEAGVPEYWVVNLPERVVEVHTDVTDGEYRTITRYRAGESISLAAFPDIAVEVDDFLA